MSMQLKAAIIGCGAIAEEHLKCLAQIDGIEAAAYCDTALPRAQSMLDRYGGMYATDDVEKVFRDDGIDAVYICTYHDTHAPLVERACEAGKQIMLEKPMALTAAECFRIGDAVERSGVTLMTAFKLRYYPMVERARTFLPNPIMTIAQVIDNRWADDFWAQDPIKGGGNVISQGCHAADMLYYLNGSEPLSVFAEGGTYNHSNPQVIDTMAATYRFTNGRIASLAVGDCGLTPYVSKFSFQMADGVKSVHLHNRLMTGVFFDGGESTTINDPDEGGMLAENHAFIHALQTGTQPPTTYRDGLRATMMILKAFDAIRTRIPQIISF
jgi:predicted dehydrogenase